MPLEGYSELIVSSLRFKTDWLRHAMLGIGILGMVTLPVSAQVVGGEGSQDSLASVAIDPEAAPRPTLRALRAVGSITIDGRLDESSWANATPATDFVQSTPRTGMPATERTEVRVLFDDNTLYIGAMMYDSEPDRIVAQRMTQDFYSPNEDIIGMSLDTFLDRRNAYYLMINPNGAIRDGQAYDNSRTSNVEWEGIMRVETERLDDGWSAELAIPFSTLRFDPSKARQEWGINFVRRVRRKVEDSMWAPVARRTRVHRMAEAGYLVGLPRLEGSRNITVKPFMLGERASGTLPGAAEQGSQGDVGLDIKWGLTPGLTADLTWQTDFSQVEADQEQVNLTRFPLFFPEKREFFIENSGTYAFGDLSERNYRLGASPRDFTLFHSRRIGLQGGQPVPISAGGRLTGRVGGFEVGALNMQTSSTDLLGSESFTVARVRRTVLGSVDVGGIFTNRQVLNGRSATELSDRQAQTEYNRAWGVDVNARLFGNLMVHSYLAETHEPGQSGNNQAARASLAWRDAFWDMSVLYRSIGEAFNPDVGFVRRRAVRHYYATVGAHPRPPVRGLNEANPYLEIEEYRDFGGMLETRNVTGGMALSFLDGSVLTLLGTDRYERLDREFSLSGGIVPAGVHEFREASAKYVSDASRPLSGEMRIGGGGYFQGARRSIGGTLAWRVNPHLGFDFGADHNVIEFEGAPFTVDVFSGRVDYALSTRVLAGGWLQYNDATREMITNVRLNWIHSPLSDFFLVFSERRTSEGEILDRRLTAKLTKLFAF